MSEEIDYKKLLEKYMNHVLNEEGATYVDYKYTYLIDSGFTEKEIEELRKISNNL